MGVADLMFSPSTPCAPEAELRPGSPSAIRYGCVCPVLPNLLDGDPLTAPDCRLHWHAALDGLYRAEDDVSLTPEYPEEILDRDAAPGTPAAEQAEKKLDDVWCMRHGARWSFFDGYWRCLAPDIHHADDIAQEVGGISCQPAVNWDPAEHPEMALKWRMVNERYDAEGINPDGPLL